MAAAGAQAENRTHASSWKALGRYIRICTNLSDLLHAQAVGDPAAVKAGRNRLVEPACRLAPRLHRVLDTCLLITTVDHVLEQTKQTP